MLLRRQMERITFRAAASRNCRHHARFRREDRKRHSGNLKYVKGFSGGSEAVEAALKFVRQYFKQTGHPGKYKFISRYFGYHGGTFGGMGASGTGPRKTQVRAQMRAS